MKEKQKEQKQKKVELQMPTDANEEAVAKIKELEL